MNRQPDDFDALMEESLHTYANAEPRPDLEQSILNGIQAATTDPTSTSQAYPLRQYWGWLATAAAACTVAAILLYQHPAPQPRTGTIVPSKNPFNPVLTNPVPANPIGSPTLTPVRARHHVHLRRPTLSEPAAASLAPTPQEKLLAQFVSAHRNEALTVAKAQAALDQPITVRPLAIQPIHVQPIQFQPISSEPILVGSIQIDSLDHAHPSSF
jgi:hypothetical protein